RLDRSHTVIRDNAPAFIFGSQIFNEPGTGIEHITPYSPWEGGFCERLIKSVKEALIKATGIRATMHLSRPRTYQESNINNNITPYRPIDFLQDTMNVTLPLDASEQDYTDTPHLEKETSMYLQSDSKQ
ncbi:unnamed protein product, partial [Haemonchus placei]|uniref:GMC_oxred_C domain-containing protein n=1 Tax=Haemonchus placei TaxID=6290 RepID=A0A0N4W5C7_HAEPC